MMVEPDSPSDPFDRWLEGQLKQELGSVTGRPAPRWALRAPRRRGLRLDTLMAAGVAVLALGGGTAFVAADMASALGGHGGQGGVVTPTAVVCPAGSTGGQTGCRVEATGHSATAPGGPTASGTETASSLAGASPSPAASNHGQAVSQAAQTCPTGPDGVHGKCVSSVAHGSPEPSAAPTPGSHAGHH
jgi:hypothetical protein